MIEKKSIEFLYWTVDVMEPGDRMEFEQIDDSFFELLKLDPFNNYTRKGNVIEKLAK